MHRKVEHFIKKVIKEEKLECNGVEYYRVELISSCCGEKHEIRNFTMDEWKETQKCGYYVDYEWSFSMNDLRSLLAR